MENSPEALTLYGVDGTRKIIMPAKTSDKYQTKYLLPSELITIFTVIRTMNKLLASVLTLLLLLNSLSLSAQQADEPMFIGRWLTAKQDTVIRIELCDASLCGYIDWVHPDEDQFSHDGETLCGQKVLWGLTQSKSDHKLWVGGTIYRADDNKKYSAQLHYLGPEELSIRGYIALPVIGKSYKLTKVLDSSYPSCN